MSTQISISPVIKLEVNTTPITGGSAGQILFQTTGNTVGESANLSWNNTNLIFTLGSTATRIFNFRPEDTTGTYGNSCSIRGGNGNGRLDFYSASNITEVRDNVIMLTSVSGPAIQVASYINLNLGGSTRLQVASTTGNVLIGTTTDAGFKLDVNGTARVQGNTTFLGSITGSNAGRFVIAAQNFAVNITSNNPMNGEGSLITTGEITTTDSQTKNVINVNNAVTSTLASFNTLNGFAFTSTINQTLGTIRGLFIAPTLTASTNFRAIETTVGNVLLGTTSGNVGIGTSSPTNRLEVSGSSRFTTTINVGGNGSTGTSLSSGFIVFDNGNAVANSLVHCQAAQTSIFANPQSFAAGGFEPDSGGISSSNAIAFMNGSTTRMKIPTTGNVLINTTTDAGYKLDVNGTARVSGQVDIVGLTTMQISTVQQINSRLVQFNVNGASGGWASGYEFRAGGNTIYGTATAFRIWGNSATNNRVGIGDLTEANLQNGSAQLYINSQITGGRNAGVRITPSTFSTTQFSGIQFDFNNKDLNGGAFLGTQYNPLNNGYDMDLVVLTTSAAPNSYAETARFMGKFNSFYVGTDKTLAVASAKLQVESTTQGFLPPRMTTTQKNAIATPATGLMVYDTDLNRPCFYNGSSWITL